MPMLALVDTHAIIWFLYSDERLSFNAKRQFDIATFVVERSTSVSENVASLEQILPAALQLSSLDKVRLIERLIRVLESDFAEPVEKPYESLYGILADLGPAPSAEEIDEVRREMWANFPREDIA